MNPVRDDPSTNQAKYFIYIHASIKNIIMCQRKRKAFPISNGMNPVRSRDRVAKTPNINKFIVITMNKIKLQTRLDRDLLLTG